MKYKNKAILKNVYVRIAINFRLSFAITRVQSLIINSDSFIYISKHYLGFILYFLHIFVF
jgi:hypothetical protein